MWVERDGPPTTVRDDSGDDTWEFRVEVFRNLRVERTTDGRDVVVVYVNEDEVGYALSLDEVKRLADGR